MNPLSAHPPRTPKSSVNASNSMPFSHTDARRDDIEEHTAETEVELDDEEEGAQEKSPAQNQVRTQDIWREFLKTSTGRDKALKLIQYSMNVYLFFHRTVSRRMPVQGTQKRAFETELLHRLESTTSGLSMARKCLIMFNWLTPVTSILAEHSASPAYGAGGTKASSLSQKPLLHTFLHASPPILLELIQSVADDVYTWSKLGLLGRRTGERAGRFADYCWLASTLVELVENHVEHSMIITSQRAVESRLYAESMAGATAKSAPRNTKIDDRELKLLRRQAYWLQVQRTKLLMDLIFVSFEVFKWQRGREAVKALSGLASALLSSSKLYDRHRKSLIKAKTSSF